VLSAAAQRFGAVPQLPLSELASLHVREKKVNDLWHDVFQRYYNARQNKYADA
jgi:hypothetical protein